MRILAIETSCDETGVALVEASGTATAPRFRILKNIVSSQIPVHRPFGGVVPNLAKREHIKNLPIVLRKIFQLKSYAGARKSDVIPAKAGILQTARTKIPVFTGMTGAPINLIAVTVGPGLEPALWTGITFAQELSKKLKVPLVGANHLEGHLYSFLAEKTVSSKFKVPAFAKASAGRQSSKVFPAIALIVSGGHTILLKLDSLTKWKKLGETRDDAAGEAFDKVARMMGLPYPGGPEIAKLALRQTQGKPKKEMINFPRPMLHDKSYDFSFSGLKTAVLYYLRDNISSTNYESRTNVRMVRQTHHKIRKFAKDSLFADVAASFQQAVVDVLVHKTMRAAREFRARSIILCGGVAANKQLRRDMGHAILRLRSGQARDMGINFFVPPSDLNGDNAAMIAIAAYLNHLRKKKYKLTAQGNLNL